MQVVKLVFGIGFLVSAYVFIAALSYDGWMKLLKRLGMKDEVNREMTSTLSAVVWPLAGMFFIPVVVFIALPIRAAKQLPGYLERRKKARKAVLQDQLRESLNLTEDEDVVVTPAGCGCKACITYRAQMNATYKRMP